MAALIALLYLSMQLLAVGLNHTTAPVSLREQLALGA